MPTGPLLSPGTRRNHAAGRPVRRHVGVYRTPGGGKDASGDVGGQNTDLGHRPVCESVEEREHTSTLLRPLELAADQMESCGRSRYWGSTTRIKYWKCCRSRKKPVWFVVSASISAMSGSPVESEVTWRKYSVNDRNRPARICLERRAATSVSFPSCRLSPNPRRTSSRTSVNSAGVSRISAAACKSGCTGVEITGTKIVGARVTR